MDGVRSCETPVLCGGFFFSLFRRGCFWRDIIRRIYDFGVVFGLFLPRWPEGAARETIHVTESHWGRRLLQGPVSGERGTCGGTEPLVCGVVTWQIAGDLSRAHGRLAESGRDVN